MTRDLDSVCKIPFDTEQRSQETFWNSVYWRGIWFTIHSFPNPYLSFDVLQCRLEKKKKRETQLWIDSIEKSTQSCGISHCPVTEGTLGC